MRGAAGGRPLLPAYRLRPFTNRLARARYRPLEHFATEVVEIFPAVEEMSPVIHALPGQAARATAGADGLDLAKQLAYFAPHAVTHKAVLRFTIPDTFAFANGFALKGRTYNRDGSKVDIAALLTAPVAHVERAHYCMEDRAYLYFGHWLRQFSTRLMFEGDGLPVIHRPSDKWRDAALWEEMLGMPRSPARQYHVGELFYYQDHAQGPHKRARYRVIADRLAVALSARDRGDDAPAERVYLRRPGGGAAREIANEPALIAALERAGFRILDQEREGTEAVYQALRRARLAVAMEGSHMNPISFLMAPGGTMLLLNPADRFNLGHMSRAACFGLHCATLVADAAPGGGYTVDPGAVLETIALAEAGRDATPGWRPLRDAAA